MSATSVQCCSYKNKKIFAKYLVIGNHWEIMEMLGIISGIEGMEVIIQHLKFQCKEDNEIMTVDHSFKKLIDKRKEKNRVLDGGLLVLN